MAHVVVGDCLDAYEKVVDLMAEGMTPDLIIIDFGRNWQTGERFAQSLDALTLAVPVIIISEYGDENMIGEGLAAHGAMCLSKPFEPQELISHDLHF